MGALLKRYEQIEKQAADLRPLIEPLRKLFVEGNKQALLAGQTMDGQTVAPLKASTVKHRQGTGPPRVPHGAQSTLIRAYRVDITPAVATLAIRAGWPGVPWVRYFVTGTNDMVARDPSGFRPEDKARSAAMLREHVMKGR